MKNCKDCKNNYKSNYENDTEYEYDYLNSASSQDCTGLIPSGLVDEAELENYEDIYPFLPKAVPEDTESYE